MMPDDATVNEHLGDAYWRVGRTTEARYQWERSLTFKPEKETADALRDKIEKGMPAFAGMPIDVNTPTASTTIMENAAPSQVQ